MYHSIYVTQIIIHDADTITNHDVVVSWRTWREVVVVRRR